MGAELFIATLLACNHAMTSCTELGDVAIRAATRDACVRKALSAHAAMTADAPVVTSRCQTSAEAARHAERRALAAVIDGRAVTQ